MSLAMALNGLSVDLLLATEGDVGQGPDSFPRAAQNPTEIARATSASADSTSKTATTASRHTTSATVPSMMTTHKKSVPAASDEAVAGSKGA